VKTPRTGIRRRRPTGSHKAVQWSRRYIRLREIRTCCHPTSQGPSVAFGVINRTSGSLRGEPHRLVRGPTCLRGGWVTQPIPCAAQSTPNAHPVRSGPVEMRVVIPGQDRWDKASMWNVEPSNDRLWTAPASEMGGRERHMHPYWIVASPKFVPEA
jgi:hypothetical protein